GFKLGIDALTGAAMGSKTGVSDWATPLRVVIPFRSSLGLVTVLPGSVPDPEDEAMLELMNLDIISVRLANWFCTELDKPELDKLEVDYPGVYEVRRESGKSDLICNHLRAETGVSLVIIG
nr:hypothetical protein [Tanacetum cinerariifolium]